MSSNIDRRIVELVTAHWASNQKILKLTQLGKTLRGEFDLSKELMGAKLKPYLETKLATSLRLIGHPDDRLTWGAVPESVRLPDDLRPLFQSVLSTEQSAFGAVKRVYDKTLWAAFSIPLTTGEKRIIRLGPPIEFKTVTQIPDGWLEIDPSLIIPAEVGTDLAERSARLANNISKWAVQHGVDPETIVVKKAEYRNRSLLELLVGALDENGLNEITISLKTAKILMEKHV